LLGSIELVELLGSIELIVFIGLLEFVGFWETKPNAITKTRRYENTKEEGVIMKYRPFFVLSKFRAFVIGSCFGFWVLGRWVAWVH
jgi:hypothetical protein